MYDNNLRCHVFKDYNIPFDEKGTTVGSVRLVQWVKGDDEPNPDKAKLEIRKLYTGGTEEKVGKGYTFSTPEGPSELTEGLLKIGYGDTKKCLKTLATRDDFKESVENIDVDEDDNDEGMFDMRELLMNIEVSADDEDDEEE
jgi:hypothetical protein